MDYAFGTDPVEKTKVYRQINAMGIPLCISAASDMNSGFLKGMHDKYFPRLSVEDTFSRSSNEPSEVLFEITSDPTNPFENRYFTVGEIFQTFLPKFEQGMGHFGLTYKNEAQKKFQYELLASIVVSLRSLWHKQALSNVYNTHLNSFDADFLKGVVFNDLLTSVCHGIFSVYSSATQLALGYTGDKFEGESDEIKLVHTLIYILRSGYISNYTAGLKMDVLARSNYDAGICPHNSSFDTSDLTRDNKILRSALNVTYGRSGVAFSACPFSIPIDDDLIDTIELLYFDCPKSKAMLKRLNSLKGQTGIDLISNGLAKLLENYLKTHES